MAGIIVIGLFQDRFATQRAGERLVRVLGTDAGRIARPLGTGGGARRSAMQHRQARHSVPIG